VLWLALLAWLFAAGGTVDYLHVIVSGFILIALRLPLILARLAAMTVPRARTRRRSAIDAAALIALPIAAVSIRMTLFGIAFVVAEHSRPQPPPAAYSSGSVVKNNG